MKKNLILISIAVLVLMAFYLLISNKEEEKTSNSKKSYSSNQSIAREAIQKDSLESSLFDSNSGFLDFSGVGDNSQSYPLTTQNLTEEEKEKRRKLLIEKYKELAERFPGNRFIPREYTPEEKEKMERREANMNFLTEKIISGEELTPNEQAYFYFNKLEEIKEKLEIIEYAKKKFEEDGILNETTRKIIDERLNSIMERRKIYNQELESAKRNGGSEEAYDPM